MGPRAGLGGCGKSCAPNRESVLRPSVCYRSRYAYYAIPAHEVTIKQKNKLVVKGLRQNVGKVMKVRKGQLVRDCYAKRIRFFEWKIVDILHYES